jgi:co-chaperonin GroES (HSP10)
MKLKPLHDQVLVELNDAALQAVTAGGIHIPDNAKIHRTRLMRKGRIVATGGKVSGERVKLGDEVIFIQQSGYEVPSWPGFDHAEQKLRMLKEDELIGVVEP